MSLDAVKAIEALLSDRIGLDCGAVGSNLISHAAEHRMRERGVSTPEVYLALLAGSESEFQSLVDEVVIPESWFFRDEVPFRLVQEHAQAGWTSNPARPPLRILSIPCAGGEEPYSLVIALDEIGLAANRYIVDAVDISRRQLALARRGIFRSNAFRGIDTERRDRYFQGCASGFELRAPLRDRVRFIQGSILDPGLLQDKLPYHVVLCRNLLIYLNEASRTRALATLDRLLADDGLLIVGHADRLNTTGSELKFTPIGARGSFAHQRAKPPGPRPGALDPGAERPSLGASSPPSCLPRPDQMRLEGPQAAARRASTALDRGTSEPGLDGRIEQFPGSPKPAREDLGAPASAPGTLLDQATALANQGQHQRAIEFCQKALALRGPDAATYYLMGVIYQTAGNGVSGETCFQRAVYLDPEHDEALLALALTAERRGELVPAARYRRRAERAISRRGRREE